MKKFLSVAFMMVCLTTFLSAQQSLDTNGKKFTLGVLGGLNIPQLSGGNGNELSRDYSSRRGEAFGLSAFWYLNSKFAIGANALYSSEGGQRNGMQAIDGHAFNNMLPAGTYLYADFNNESILNYLEIPVMVKYSVPVTPASDFYVNLGPYTGFLLNAKQKTSGSSVVYADRSATIPVSPGPVSFDASSNTTSSIRSVNFGLTGGVGLTQSIGIGDLFLDLRGAYGLRVIQKDPADGSSHSGSLLIALGYSFPL